MSSPNRRHMNIALAACVAVFACVSLAHIPGLTLGLGYLAPAVFVFVLLWLGHYPGERLLLSHSRRTERRHCTSPLTVLRRGALRHMPRGGGLLACALAGRAPPPEPQLLQFFQAFTQEVPQA